MSDKYVANHSSFHKILDKEGLACLYPLAIAPSNQSEKLTINRNIFHNPYFITPTVIYTWRFPPARTYRGLDPNFFGSR